MRWDRFFFVCGVLLLVLACVSFFWDEERAPLVIIEETHRTLNLSVGEETTVVFKISNRATGPVEVVGLAEC